MDRVDRLRSLIGDENSWEEPERQLQSLSLETADDLAGRDEDEAAVVFNDINDNRTAIKGSQLKGARHGQFYGGPSLDQEQEQEQEQELHVPVYNLLFSEELKSEEPFCHLNALVKFPYEFIIHPYRSQVAELYFSKGKLYDNCWDFFYIYPLPVQAQKPIILVPTLQVEQFLQSINCSLGCNLSLPSSASFKTSFPIDGTPRPRYLGRSTDREVAEGLKLSAPSASWRPDTETNRCPEPSGRSLEDFRRRIEALTEVEKKRKATLKIKKTTERHENQQSWTRQIKRIQRYVGLRVSQRAQEIRIKESLKYSGLQWLEYDTAVQAMKLKFIEEKPPFSYEACSPYSKEDSVIFICIDVEAYEHGQNTITEIGFATLDSRDLDSFAPGPNGGDWMKLIRASHYRIREYKHLVNRDFVAGCPDMFQFGASEFISIKDAPSIIASHFKPPYTNPTANVDGAKRNIVLVGHDLPADVRYLQKIGYDVHNLSNLKDSIDTSFMYRALRRESNPRSLGGVLSDLGLTGWWLHNAGNDAVYTLQAMIAIALKDMAERESGDLKERQDELKKNRVAEQVEEAIAASWAQQQGWSSASDDDGGDATGVRPV